MIIRAVDGGGNKFRRLDVNLDNFFKLESLDFTPVSSTEIKDVAGLLDFVSEDLPANIEGIAYGVAGVIRDYDYFVQSPNIHFLDGVSLGTLTVRRTRRRAAVFNDMEAAINGMAFGLPDEPYFMGITWSSGIGLRVWAHHQVLSVAEGGHMVLDLSPFAPLCGCGKRGHAEAIVSGDAIKRRVLTEAALLGIPIPEGVHPCRLLDESYLKGEKWAVDFYKMIGRGMGIFLANIQSLLHLPLIVFKGTFAERALEPLEPLIRETMYEVLIDPSWAYEENLRIETTPFPNDLDALIGAAAAVKFYDERIA